jgi:hypothetical protein
MATAGLPASAFVSIGLSIIHGSRRTRTFSANLDTTLLRDLTSIPGRRRVSVTAGCPDRRWPRLCW